ncbi:ferredoxin family protein [Enterococcus hirae]|nr:ferredoxin family protein [Enterococcus hirae]
MSIRINEARCTGCRRCIEACPGNLIKQEHAGKRKAVMAYPKDCWGCTSCIKACPEEAICFYLGADIGGLGSTVTASENREKIRWKIKMRGGQEEEIVIERNNANKY